MGTWGFNPYQHGLINRNWGFLITPLRMAVYLYYTWVTRVITPININLKIGSTEMLKINKHHQQLQHFFATTTSCKIRSFRGSRPEAATSQVVGACPPHIRHDMPSRYLVTEGDGCDNLNLSRSQPLFAQNVHLHSLVTRQQAVSGVAVWTWRNVCGATNLGSLAPGSHTEWSWKPSIGAGELNLWRVNHLGGFVGGFPLEIWMSIFFWKPNL